MKLRVSPLVWSEFLELLNLGDIISPVEVFFDTNGCAEVRASDNTKTIQYVLPSWRLINSTVDEEGSVVIDPAELYLDNLKFKKSKEITISASDGVMVISDDKGNMLNYYMKDSSAAVTIPKDKTPKFDEDDKVLFKKKVKDEEGNESIVQGSAESIVKIDSTQLQLAVNDMTKHAKTEYVEFLFSDGANFSKTGHFDTKAKESTSALLATLDGNDISFVLPKTFADLIKPLEGEIEIQGADGSPGVVFKHSKIGKGDVIIVLMRQKVAKTS